MKIAGQDCVSFSHFHAYKNWEQGFVNRADFQQVFVTKMILADNRNQISINAGDGGEYPTVSFMDSAVIGKLMDDAPEYTLEKIAKQLE